MLRDDIITVFGGSGFLGRHVVRALAKAGYRVRVASRRPHLAQDLRVMGVVGQVQLVQANIRVPSSVARAVEGASAVINLVGVLAESGRQNFSSLHTAGAKAVAEAAAAEGIERFVQVSAIGAYADSPSRYARSKAAGEAAVKAAVPTATILRPSIVFGTDDGFFNMFGSMARFAPALPLFGGGKTRFQPVFAGDVAEAVLKSVESDETRGETYELGGPGVYTFKELMAFILEETARPRFLIPLPFAVGTVMATLFEFASILPFVQPLLTRDQLIQLQRDNVAGEGMKGLDELGIKAETVEAIVPGYLARYRRHGQFHEKEA